MNNSKSKNVIRSTFFGCLYYLSKFVMGLISRKLFLMYIGMEYLSVAQVINSLLTVLSFSELGIQNAVLFMLYRPMAEEDVSRIRQLVMLYRRFNRYVGCAVFIIGLGLMPFLGTFIDTQMPMQMVYLIYFINLLYSASTYFMSYRTVLLSAAQKDYISSIIVTLVSVGGVIVQCGIIYFTADYILYLLTGILFNVVSNVTVYNTVGRKMPYVKNLSGIRADSHVYEELKKNVKATFAIRICGVVIDNTDNILVSLIHTLMVGYCSNYTTVTVHIKSFVSTFQSSLLHSLGVANADKSDKEKYHLFKQVVLVNTFLAGVITVPLGVLWDEFIILWLGEAYVVSAVIVWSLLLNFCCQLIDASVWQFRDTTGMFVYVKGMLIFNAVLNIVLSVIMGRLIGIAGVYLATVVSNFLTDYWYDARVVYTKVFHVDGYKKYMLYLTANIAGIMALSYGLKLLLGGWQLGIRFWMAKGAVSVFAFVLVFWMIYGRRREYRELLELLRGFLDRKKSVENGVN